MTDVLFVGAFERNLDDKGRVALPGKFREHLGEHCYLAKGHDKCMHVVPASVFESEAARLTARAEAGEISRNEVRALAYSATLVVLDKQGRINVDEQLRTYAELAPGTAITVAGAFDRLEIWSTDRFSQVNTSGTGDLAGDDE